MSLEGGKSYDKVVGMIVFGCGFIGVNLSDIYEWVCVILRVYDDVIEFKMVDGKKVKLEMKVNDRNEIINKVLLSIRNVVDIGSNDNMERIRKRVEVKLKCIYIILIWFKYDVISDVMFYRMRK